MTVEDKDPVNQLSDCGAPGWTELSKPISEGKVANCMSGAAIVNQLRVMYVQIAHEVGLHI